ncbi:hypothetical protein ACQ4PT_023294 [Festuca glaucescens]
MMGTGQLKESTMPEASFLGFQDFQELPEEQVVFANAFEHEFYKTMISTKLDSSPGIFEVNKVWVDHMTLSLSMTPGGWIHPYVMDCFGMLSNVAQIHQIKEGKRQKKKSFLGILSSKKSLLQILMDPMLNHSDPSYNLLFRFNNVGFRLENAGLVRAFLQNFPIHHLEKQWILIVANFFDQTFDILNPDNSIEKFQSIVTTVTFNFKSLFKNSYPGCRLFNIHDFKLRYIEVPNHNFRYDSGVLIMHFIRSYNGIIVPPISNGDVEAIRQRISCQLVTSTFNEHQIPLVKQFLAVNAPNLVR